MDLLIEIITFLGLMAMLMMLFVLLFFLCWIMYEGALLWQQDREERKRRGR